MFYVRPKMGHVIVGDKGSRGIHYFDSRINATGSNCGGRMAANKQKDIR